jgi:hypothetical protein
MNKEDLVEQLNKSEDEIDEIIEEIKEALMEEDKIVTPTSFREDIGLHHARYKLVITYLVNNDEDVVEIPSSTKGRSLAHRNKIQEIIDEALS